MIARIRDTAPARYLRIMNLKSLFTSSLAVLALAFGFTPASAQQFRATTSIHYGGALAYPGTVQNGDVLILHLVSMSAVTAPTGWTQTASYPWTVYGYRSYIFTRVRAGETSVSVPGTNGGAVLLAYSGTGGMGSVGAFAESAQGVSTLVVPGITPQSAKGKVLGLVTDRDIVTLTPATGFTTRSNAGTGYFGNNVADKAFGSTAPTGNQTWTQGSNYPAVGMLLELLPPPPATLSASYAPAIIVSGSTATLTYTLTNPNPTALTNARFTSSLGNVSVANATLGGSCTGVTSTPALTVGATSLDLTVASLPAGGCTLTVQVTSSTLGSHGHAATGLTTNETDQGTAANTATLQVVSQPDPPAVTSKFEPAWMDSGSQSTLRINLTSPLNMALSNVTFTGSLTGMTVANATIGGSCTGVSNSPALTVGATSLNLTVPTLPANGCSITINVTSTTTGSNPASLTGATATESTGAGATPPTAYLTVSAEDPGFLYVHADHLGTPRAITKPTTNQAVWVNENTEPFGNSQPNSNPSGLGAFVYNLRFPGQYSDQETGTSYNYFRDYDPVTGRYRQSDPIGLNGGTNTFGYTLGSPLNNADPDGQFVQALGVLCLSNPVALTGCAIGGGIILMIGQEGTKKLVENRESTKDCDCTSFPSREQAYKLAVEYAGLGPDWYSIGWDQFNKPNSKPNQIQYTRLRQNNPGLPYGYRNYDGGEVVLHPADSEHPCPHYHAKKRLSDGGRVFAFDPAK